MKEQLDLFIKQNFEKEPLTFFKAKSATIGNSYQSAEPFFFEEACSLNNLDSFIESTKSESKFQTLLFKYIDSKKLTDSEVYNKVHIDRRLFSKIRSNLDYHPSKETVLLLSFALELNLDEAIELLDSCSYTLPKNNYYDLIIRFCFINHIYKLKDINDLLDSYKCKLFNY